jgi:glycosyltransferase involved in cell wall biosynthesis
MLAEKNHQSLNLQVIPTGVNALPVASDKKVQSFRKSLGLTPTDEVVIYVGRLGEEKNLAMLIPMMEKLIRKRPNAKLVFVGDFDFRETLEEMATASRAAGKVLFAGRLPRDELSMAYQAAEVFVFPSLTDTQGLVIQEAAHTGLPLVLCDPDVSECFHDGENGFLAKNTPRDVAAKIATILSDDKLRAKFSAHSKQLAESLGERTQTEKVVALFRRAMKEDQALK